MLFTHALGMATLASPAQKRASLTLVSLESARFSHTSDALHLSLLGGVTSTLLFRRPLMSIRPRQVDARRPVLCALLRPAAQVGSGSTCPD